MESNIIMQKRTVKKISEVPDGSIYYSNTALVMVSNDDVLLHFGLTNTQDANLGTGVAKIYLSISHAKRLAAALTNSIAQYEKVFGEIKTEMKASPEDLEKMGLVVKNEQTQ